MNSMNGSLAPAFDSAAKEYDDSFTHSWTGSEQRKIVWNFLSKQVNPEVDKSVLEINCGTGEDACWLSSRGFKGLATDLSPEMLNIGKQKKEKRNIQNLEFKLADIKDIQSSTSGRTFNIIFSNFGGLNCLSPEQLRLLSKDLRNILKPKGRIIIVIMGRKCIWERLYFKLKRKTREVNRRKNMTLQIANGGNTAQVVGYYSPKELYAFFEEDFSIGTCKPIGLFIPPSYLDKAFKEKKIIQRVLIFLEKMFTNFSSLSDYADHYLIELHKR